MTESLIPELLRREDWGEDGDMVSSFLASPWFSLLEESLGSLKRESLYRSHAHGVGHIERVMVHGAMCARAERLGEGDTRLLLAMCAYHDTGRSCDYLDASHGLRSAEKLASLTGLRGEALAEAMAGVEAHSQPDGIMEDILASHRPGDLPRARLLAQMLKDSDGLDRVRIHDLDTGYLRRPPSRERGSFAWRLFERYAALEAARGLNGEAEGFDLPTVHRVRAMVTERFAAGDGGGATALRVWDELTGAQLADVLGGPAGETELCGIPAAARRYFGALFAREGREKGEIEEMYRVFLQRFCRQYGSDRCAGLRPKKGCNSFAVDSILFTCQYLYEENRRKGAGEP